MNRKSGSQTVKAILTDVQFWVPAGVLIAGILLLVFLH
ncbi:MAG TPA: translocated intimin receptor Tir [Acidobacteriaceae bacterium]